MDLSGIFGLLIKIKNLCQQPLRQGLDLAQAGLDGGLHRSQLGQRTAPRASDAMQRSPSGERSQ